MRRALDVDMPSHRRAGTEDTDQRPEGQPERDLGRREKLNGARREHQGEEATEVEDPSVFPISIPLIAGPGSIATVILLAGQKPGIEGFALVMSIVLAVLSLMLVMFLVSGVLERLLGKTGINVVTRLLGMLLAALSVQFILDGLRAFGFAAG